MQQKYIELTLQQINYCNTLGVFGNSI